MDVLIAIFLFVGSLLGAVVGNMMASEFYDRSASTAQRLVEWAVRQLPRDQQARYQEEWMAHLEECPGKLSKLWHALELLLAARGIAQLVEAAMDARAKQLSAELRALLTEYAALERNGDTSDFVFFEEELQLDDQTINKIERLAKKFDCSTSIVIGAVIAFGLKHHDRYKF